MPWPGEDKNRARAGDGPRRAPFDTHYRLRPLLRELAATRIAGGTASSSTPPEPRPRLLGPDAWELVRPDRPPPEDRPRPACRARRSGRDRAEWRRCERARRLRERAEPILDEVERAVVGKRDALELVLLGLLADGHVLIEDYPGLAKTLIARSFAQATALELRAGSSSRPT